MTTRAELQKQIAALEAAQARAEILDELSRSLSLARNEDELLQILAWLTFAATTVNYPGHSGSWTKLDVC